MDSIFQSLLLNQSTTTATSNNSSGITSNDKGGSSAVVDVTGATIRSSSSSSSSSQQQPRPSRYAQLIPNEALRLQQQHYLPSSSYSRGVDGDNGGGNHSNDDNMKKGRRSRSGSIAKDDDYNGTNTNNNTIGSSKKGKSSSDADEILHDNTDTAEAEAGKEEDANINIRVYKMDESTGQLELLPADNYNVVYYSDDDNGEEQAEGASYAALPSGSSDLVVDEKDEKEADVEMKTEEEGEDTNAKDDDDAKKEDTTMDIDANNKEDTAVTGDYNDQSASFNDENQDTIYIVKGPSITTTITNNNNNNNTYQPQENDTASSSSDSDYYDGDDIDNELSKSVPLAPNPLSAKESLTASTLARALVSRTEGFDKLRPKYAGLMEEEEQEEEQQQRQQEGKDGNKDKKQKQTEDKGKNTKASGVVGGGAGGTAAASSTTPSSGKGKDDAKDLMIKHSKNTESTLSFETEQEDFALAQQRQQKYLQSHKLITSLSKSANILDGDTPATLQQLSLMRKWQERSIAPKMQGVELDDWEDGIDWEGGGSSSSDEEKEGEEEGDKMDVDMAKSNGADTTTTSNGDFKPPEPFGGHPKRPRRMMLPQYDDPIEFLLEPRNPRLEALDLATAVNWEGAGSDDDDSDDDESSIHVPLILQSSIAGQSVATLLAPNPSSRPLPFESHANYQRRYDSEMASDITSTAELTKPGAGSDALERYKAARQRKREQMAKDKQSRVTEVMSALSLTGTGRRITSSLMGPGGAERTGRPSRHAVGSSSVHDAEYVEQLEIVYNHNLVRPDLTLSEYRQFHRPRLPLLVVSPSCPWQFQTRIVTENKRGARGRGGAGSTAADGSTIVGSYHAMMGAGNKGQNKIRTETDLSPTHGDLVVMEYSEERPPLSMTKGMTCRIVNYYRGDRSRCPISAGGGDRPLRKRHGDKAAAANQGPAPAGPSNRVERPPRLIGPNQYTLKSAADLIGIVSKKKKKSKEAAALEAKKAKENAIDILPEGVTEVLHQKVHGPFIGEVEEGKTQTGLISNLYAAPLFRHETPETDFLMILGKLQDPGKSKFSSSGTSVSSSSSSSGGLGVVLRPLPPNIYCVGQTEPRVKVFAPNTNDEKKFINTFVPYQVAKNIQRHEAHDGNGLTFDDIKDRLFAHTTIPNGQLRIRIKQVANFERSNNGIWSLKGLGEDDFPGVEALGRKVSPEGVAAYESQCAAMRRLADLGVRDLFSGTNQVQNLASIMLYLNGAVQAAMERRIKLKKVFEIKKRQRSPQLVYFEKAFEKLDAEYKEVKRRQEIGKFIYEELQLSPWNISGEYIDVHKRAVGGSMMKLTGIGDPSGVGEAFDFLRVADSRASKSTPNSDGALNEHIQKITGTQNDLRKLTMKQMASLLRSYGMKDKQIVVLKRWDRVHVIRDLSTKAASDGMGDEMDRFARGEKLRLSDQRQNYKQRIQEIWRRQIASLSADAGNELAARSDLGSGSSAKDKEDTDVGSDAEKEKEDGSDSSDEDDDFLMEMEMDMANTGEANRLMKEQVGAHGSSELSKDAREFAALQRQREEERAMQEGLKGSALGMGDKPKKKFKVVRRKIIKTRPDGTQTITFEFIVNRDKVDEIIAKKKQKEADEKKLNEKKRKKKIADYGHADPQDTTCVGHAIWEDEDNSAKAKRSVKLKMKRETTSVRKKPGPKKGSHSKLTSGIKHTKKLEQEQRKKKRMKAQEEADLYKSTVKRQGTSNRKERGSARERMPHVILSDRFESIRSDVEARPNAGAFFKPVNRELYPQYYEIIHEPIDLNTIREKNRKYDYKTADNFLADFELMKMNAIKFNGKGSPLANEAVEIWQFVKSTTEQHKQEFNEMEEAVSDQMSGKNKKKAKSKSDTTSNSKAAPMNTANVVLDGIETQVNLGTTFSFALGDSDSDSD